jgi:hypothetical protein
MRPWMTVEEATASGKARANEVPIAWGDNVNGPWAPSPQSQYPEAWAAKAAWVAAYKVEFALRLAAIH